MVTPFLHCYCRVKVGSNWTLALSGRSELSYDARVALDCQYVQRWTAERR